MGECLIIRTGGGSDTSDATATADNVLTGYSCYANESLIIGSMIDQSELANQTLGPGGSFTIPEGYHDGNTKVEVSALSGSTSANAAAANILSGYTGWVNGSLVTGTMTNRGTVNKTLAANSSYTIPAGWHSGSGKVTQSLTTQAGKTVTPKTSNQTVCAASRWTTGNVIIAGASTLTATNIKNNVTIFGVKGTCNEIDGDYKIFWKGESVGDCLSGGTSLNVPSGCSLSGHREPYNYNMNAYYDGAVDSDKLEWKGLYYCTSSISTLQSVHEKYPWFNIYQFRFRIVNQSTTDKTYWFYAFLWTWVINESGNWYTRKPAYYSAVTQYGSAYIPISSGEIVAAANCGKINYTKSVSIKIGDYNGSPTIPYGIVITIHGSETNAIAPGSFFKTTSWADFTPSLMALYYTADKQF